MPFTTVLHRLIKATDAEAAVLDGEGQYGRGLILQKDVGRDDSVARIPLSNVLLVSDKNPEGLSIFGTPCGYAKQGRTSPCAS